MFPLFLYGVGGEEDMIVAKEAGFNSAFMGPQDHEKRHGLKAISDVGGGYTEEDWLLNYIIDEPEGCVEWDELGLLDYRQQSPLRLKFPPDWVDERVSESKERWPSVPTGVMLHDLLNRNIVCQCYMDTDVDVVLIDPYPVIEEHDRPAEWVALQCQLAHLMTKRPIWVVLQAYSARKRNGTWAPVPTPDELKDMAKAALALDIQGLGFFAYRFPDGPGKLALLPEEFPELWDAVKEIVREANERKDMQ